MRHFPLNLETGRNLGVHTSISLKPPNSPMKWAFFVHADNDTTMAQNGEVTEE